jgi:hypothetical protein
MRMIARHFLRRRVRGHRSLDRRIIRRRDAALRETTLQIGLIAKALCGISAVSIADTIVLTGEIVQEHGCPKVVAPGDSAPSPQLTG